MSAPGNTRSRRIVGILAVTQILAWGSLYYAFSVLSPHMGRALGIDAQGAMAPFSWALLLGGLVAAPAGRLFDRIGGRRLMACGSLLAACGLLMLARVDSIGMYWLAWSVLGIAMALTMYEAAFATINRALAESPRRAITTLTLFGGFASTIFWPLTLALDARLGWRSTWLVYAALQLFVCAPLHALLPSHTAASAGPVAASTGMALSEVLRGSVFWKLAAAFAAQSLVSSALTVGLIRLMHDAGHPLSTVVMLAALFGPMQVAGRIAEMAIGRRVRSQTIGSVTFAALPLALGLLFVFIDQLAAVAAFCIVFGLSNGVLTILRGTLPQELFGRAHYGAIAGARSRPRWSRAPPGRWRWRH
ncbi:MFS transporter [Massilia sp. Se16.2.3]|uniref:MFS transporter n=1 Tax=Massilia sp. Se16.2.3 TaxID=2709303 RepID=UPI001604047B|nr:MFS transporter [Massilia sp. Se16.2.3]QNA99133.1 MFS transporter [Massilia sp. Se16.2.3]